MDIVKLLPVILLSPIILVCNCYFHAFYSSPTDAFPIKHTPIASMSLCHLLLLLLILNS